MISAVEDEKPSEHYRPVISHCNITELSLDIYHKIEINQ